MRTIKTNLYTINDHPNKELCFEWIRENWNDLNQHSVDELIESIKALSNEIGGTFDYSISQVPDRGEYITFKDYNKEALLLLNADDLPLTGVCWDVDLIEGMQEGNPNKALEMLHDDTEYQYSNEGLLDMCNANEYEFNEDGTIF